MRVPWLLVCLVGLLPLAVADEGDRANYARRADHVVAAVRAGDRAALEELGAAYSLDPWLVAEVLCLRAEHEAAAAYAAVVRGPGTARLAAYVARREGDPAVPELHATIEAARSARATGEPRRALAQLDGVAGPEGSISALRIEVWRLAASESPETHREAARGIAAAARKAAGLGWIRGALDLLRMAGLAADRASDHAVALACFDEALAIALDLEDAYRVAEVTVLVGSQLHQLHRFEEAYARLESVLGRLESHGKTGLAAECLWIMGKTRVLQGRPAEAEPLLVRARDLYAEDGGRQGLAHVHLSLGSLYRNLARWQEALASYRQALAVYLEEGDEHGIANASFNIGNLHAQTSSWDEAQASYLRALQHYERCGYGLGRATALRSLGSVLERKGDLEGAGQRVAEALELLRDLGTGGMHELACLLVLGDVAYKRGDLREAVRRYEEALGDETAVRIPHFELAARMQLSTALNQLGEYRRAGELLARVLELSETVGDRFALATALSNCVTSYAATGRYAEALRCGHRALDLRRSIDDRAGAANTMLNLGWLLEKLGDHVAARRCYEACVASFGDSTSSEARFAAYLNLGALLGRTGETAAGLLRLEEARREAARVGSRFDEAQLRVAQSLMRRGSDPPEEILADLRDALAVFRELGVPTWQAQVLWNMALIARDDGKHDQARRFLEEGLAIPSEGGGSALHVEMLGELAFLDLEAGQTAEALAKLRAAVARLPTLVMGLGDERAVVARESQGRLFDLGMGAGLELTDVATFHEFLEGGRALSLLESLGGRDAVSAVVLDADLRRAQLEARETVARARQAYEAAYANGALSAIKPARAALEEAQRAELAHVDRVHLESKLAAGVVYPRAATLEEVQAALETGEALVSYVLRTRAVALVVTRHEVRVVELGPIEPIEKAAARQITAVGPDFPTAPLAHLRALVVEPLALPAAATRLLVSPDGVLFRAPLSALVTGREVTCVPSGSVLSALRSEPRKRGRQVLALGAPTYPKKTAVAPEVTLVQGGVELPALPGTGVEARAVGDVVLLGKEANRRALFEQLARKERWRAVHLACHGLLHPSNARLSSLALTPVGPDGGLLSALEVFTKRVDADLVVLSACDTAQGDVYQAEGLVGFTRAFLTAGAPRVIVGLWKVDDEASRALMVKFYELWNPKDGSDGLPTATALKAAQEYVRTYERQAIDHVASQREGRAVLRTERPWEHPYYWAAWVLWGLPD